MKRLVLAALLLVAACDKDRLPDDLSSVEGRETVDDVNLAANDEEPAPATPPLATESASDDALPANAPGDPLAPIDSNPSFDCAAAGNRVERHICSVPELGALDRRVSAAFDRAMDEANSEQADRLQNLGRQYLADRDRCRDDYCIRQAYRWYERDIFGVMGWQGPN